jgi:hypothetical protein
MKALTSLLSYHQSFELWIEDKTPKSEADKCLESNPLLMANDVRAIIIKHLTIVLEEKRLLFGRFKNMKGLKILKDVLIQTDSEAIKWETLLLLQTPLDNTKHTITLAQSGVLEHIPKIFKESKSENVQGGALCLISLVAFYLSKTNQSHIKIPVMSEEILQSVSSSSQINYNSLSQVAYLTLPEARDCVLKHLEDGKTQALFKQILPLKYDDRCEYLALLYLSVYIYTKTICCILVSTYGISNGNIGTANLKKGRCQSTL